MGRFLGETIKEIKFQDCDRFKITFESGKSLFMRAYAEFDGCGDFDDVYFEIEGADSDGRTVLELDTKKIDVEKDLL